jgi:hypothetical protein
MDIGVLAVRAELLPAGACDRHRIRRHDTRAIARQRAQA